jgi:hypothetical protein
MNTDQTQLENLLERSFKDLEEGRIHHFDSLNNFQKAVMDRVKTTNPKTPGSTTRNLL